VGWKRQALLDAGSRLPGWLIHGGLALTETLDMGRWLRAAGYCCDSFSPHRERLFESVARTVADRGVLYLEFGVWQGASMRKWSSLLKNPDSHLHGFDSFEGLPEDWIGGFAKGHFTTGGRLPDIDDSRVAFTKGWFHQTLPGYRVPPHEVLVVNIDSDLYLPARQALDFLAPHFRRGDFLYFDEFHIPHDEPRAFREFTGRTGAAFSLVGATEGFAGVMFRCEQPPDSSAGTCP
jgi:hypothetical protein